METLPVPRLDPMPQIAALALRFERANGPVMALMNRIGGSLEHRVQGLPAPLRGRIETVVTAALMRVQDLAAAGDRAPDLGARGSVALAMLTGAAGGAGGLPGALAELPVTITVILHAIRRAAREAGFDPDQPAIRAQCLAVFSAGSPLAMDDGVNTSFLGARLAVTGPALQKIVAAVAPRLATAMGQKLMAQSVPVLGALAGAALNAAYVTYYTEIARIRFDLLRLAETHGAEPVLAAFAAATVRPVILTA
jgi:hypothetical protein